MSHRKKKKKQPSEILETIVFLHTESWKKTK